MIEVFRTNIDCTDTAEAILAELQSLYSFSSVNFDLEDCDKILRVKGEGIHPPAIVAHLERKGFVCEVLD